METIISDTKNKGKFMLFLLGLILGNKAIKWIERIAYWIVIACLANSHNIFHVWR